MSESNSNKQWKRVPEIDFTKALSNPEIKNILNNWQSQMRFTEYFTIE